MAKNDKDPLWEGIPVDDPELIKQLTKARPKGKYFETYPAQGIKSITKYDTNADLNTQGYVQSRAPDYITDFFDMGTTKIPSNKVVHILPRTQSTASDPSSVYGTFEHEKQHLLNQVQQQAPH